MSSAVNNTEINTEIYIGLMSGTSLDGVDGVMVQFSKQAGQEISLLASAHQAFNKKIKQAAMDLQQAGENEIHREALLANELAIVYAHCVKQLQQKMPLAQVKAIGVHGQTIRHQPQLAYTRQTNNPALLAELSAIDVVADFRSRDVAAGGQGAPLVPAFHRALFGSQDAHRVVVNIGGMSNVSILHADGDTTGFDTGPGNVLMDAWAMRHLGKTYDEDGTWARQGVVNPDVLASLCDEDFFQLAPPKSTGRDLFHMSWLTQKLKNYDHVSPVDIQASLCAFTARTIIEAITTYAKHTQAVYVCGGGAYNQTLMQYLKQGLQPIMVVDTSVLGVAPHHVEAIAFAWLARQFILRQAGNLPSVTGARGERILGALYPA